MKRIPKEYFYIFTDNGVVFNDPKKANKFRYATGCKLKYQFLLTGELFNTYKELLDRYKKYLLEKNKQLYFDFIFD